jgi:two-component system cell cycle sensor histidine kinase/response regulator CckA
MIEGMSVSPAQTILIADDEPVVLRVTSRVLRTAGFKVIETTDGAEALAAFHARRDEITLALFDVVMPTMSGIDVLKAIRANHPTFPIILTSGYTDGWTANEPALAGIPFLAKPWEPDQLTAVIRTELARRAR